MSFSKVALHSHFRDSLKGLRCRYLSTTPAQNEKHSCRLLVVGGGSGGCSLAAKFSRSLGKNQVIVLEPATEHYYQPMFTLIGGGIKKLPDSVRPMANVLPTGALWLKDAAVGFDPKRGIVATKKGDEIQYDFMIVATGIELHYEKIPGVLEGLSMPDSGVCSNYSPKYVNRTFEAIKKFEKGNAIFTFPNTPVKCAGAPQKVLYLAEDYFKKHGKRDKANIIYNTSLGVIFGVKHYADALWKVCNKRNITVNTRRNLIEVRPKEKKAIFENLDKPEEKFEYEYALLHVTPPQSASAVLRTGADLVDGTGFLSVHKETLCHVKYPNIYGVGDCCNAPTSKTAAAVASQCGVIFSNLSAAMKGKPADCCHYDGYTSCPLVTGYGACILAEFDYSLQPLETLPISQSKERLSSYYMKTLLLPNLYWYLMLNGYWNGPKIVRKTLHCGMGK